MHKLYGISHSFTAIAEASIPKVAVITDGASGIGKGIAMKCGKEQFNAVIIIDLNETNSNKARQEFLALYPDTRLIIFIADTTKRENIVNIVDELKSKYGIKEITHLFNNAGIGLVKTNVFKDDKDNLSNLDRMMDINFWSHVYCTQLFLPFLTDHKSYIINTASLAAILNGESMYNITKHAMAAYSQTLIHEFKASGDDKYKDIQVLCLCPGFVATDIAKNGIEIIGSKDKEEIELAENINKWIHDHGITTEECADKVFESIEKGDFWIFPHIQDAHYYASIRYQSWITRKHDLKEFKENIRPNYGK